jgi:hypothetical protein
MACAPSVAVVVVVWWCVDPCVVVGVCVTCVSPPTTGSSRVSRRWVAECERATRKRETVKVCHEQLVSGGSRPGGQTGRGGISLKRARTWDQPARGVACANEAGQADRCSCEDMAVSVASRGLCLGQAKVCWYAGDTTRAVWQSREEACLRRPFGPGQGGVRKKTRGLLREGEGVHQKRALRYARAIGTIVILIGGHWLATVITLRCHRHSIVARPLVSSSLVADASKHAAMQ